MKIDELQRTDKNVNVVIRKFTENPGKFASVVLQMYWDIEKELDSCKQRRDELIKNIAKLRERNVELEKKAQAFDEIVKVLSSISKEIARHPDDNDKQKEVICKRYDDLFELMKLSEVNHER